MVAMAFEDRTSEGKGRRKASGGIQGLVQAEKLLQIAFILPSSMVVGWLLGAWAASRLHHAWLTVAGVIFGCSAGLVYVIRLAMDAEKRAASTDAENKPEKGASGREP
jgi:uncharacterized membrane protein YfcA